MEKTKLAPATVAAELRAIAVECTHAETVVRLLILITKLEKEATR